MRRKILIFISLISFANLVYATQYVIGVEQEQRYPFYYIDNGEFKGRFREALDLFAKIRNIKFIYKIADRDSLYEDLHKESIDFKFPDNPSWHPIDKAHNSPILYSEVFTHQIECMFVHKDSGQSRKRKIKNFGLVSDLILRGMDKRTKSGHVKFTKSDTCADLIIRLAKKDLDAIFCDYDAVKYLLKNSALEGEIIFNPDLPLIDNYWYVSTVSHKAIIQDLNLWVNNNRRFLENMLHAH